MLIDLYFSNYKFGIGIFLFTEEERISMFQGLKHFLTKQEQIFKGDFSK